MFHAVAAKIRSRFADRQVVVIVLAGITAYFSLFDRGWPLDGTLPTARNNLSTVPLFNLWTIWWNAEQLQLGLRDYWDAPIFYPTQRAFAFSEPQPLTLIIAPMLYSGLSLEGGYKFYLWLTLLLNGLFGYRLLRTLRCSFWLSVSGCVSLILLPLIHLQIDVLQLTSIWPVLWFWTSMIRFSRFARWSDALIAGIAWGLSFWSCMHHGMFHTLVVLPALFLLPIQWNLSSVKKVILGGVAGCMLIIPVAYPVADALGEHGFRREEQTVQALSAKPEDYLKRPPHRLVKAKSSQGEIDYGRTTLNPGYVRSLFAIFAVCLCFCRFKRSLESFFLLIVIDSFLLSLGLNLELMGWKPWTVIAENVPGLIHARNVFRFAYFLQMAVVVLGIVGLRLTGVWACRMFGRLRRSRKFSFLYIFVSIPVMFVITFETMPTLPKRAGLPTMSSEPDWCQFLRQNYPEDRAIACFPMPTDNAGQSFDGEVRWMLYGTFHRKSLVNGFSGHFPQYYNDIRSSLAKGFPTNSTLELLSEHNVDWIVCRADESFELPRRKSTTNGKTLEFVYQSEKGIEIYRLQRSQH